MIILSLSLSEGCKQGNDAPVFSDEFDVHAGYGDARALRCKCMKLETTSVMCDTSKWLP